MRSVIQREWLWIWSVLSQATACLWAIWRIDRVCLEICLLRHRSQSLQSFSRRFHPLIGMRWPRDLETLLMDFGHLCRREIRAFMFSPNLTWMLFEKIGLSYLGNLFFLLFRIVGNFTEKLLKLLRESPFQNCSGSHFESASGGAIFRNFELCLFALVPSLQFVVFGRGRGYWFIDVNSFPLLVSGSSYWH